MKKVLLFLLIGAMLFSVSCKKKGMIYIDPDAVTKTEETEKQYNRVYTDEEIPEDFDPETDYLYMQIPVGPGDARLMRVNPYSLRVTGICVDPICDHGDDYRDTCPLHRLDISGLKVITYNGCLYGFGGQMGMVMGYVGSADNYTEMYGTVGRGLMKYDMTTGQKTFLLDAEERFDGGSFSNDIVRYENCLYYTDEVEAEENTTDWELFRLNLQTEKIEDLGEYLGYARLIVADDRIWNYYGFHYNPDHPLWAEEGDYFIVTDLENQNPVKVPVYDTPVDDLDGYIAAKDSPYYFGCMQYLLYTGDQYEPHVFRFRYEERDETILRYDSGVIYHSKGDEHESVMTYDLKTGESKVLVEDLPVPDDAASIRLHSLYKDTYAIYEVLDSPVNGNSLGYLLYYMRVTLDTGEIQYIYPPEG